MDKDTQSVEQLGTNRGVVVQFSRQLVLVSIAWLAVFTTACGGGESEGIGSTQAAFAEAACARANADATFVGKIDPAVVSPRSYNTCYKGYVVDIENLEEAYTGPGNVAAANIGVQYADTPITDRTTCEGTYLATYLYYYDSGASSVGAGGFGGESSAASTTDSAPGWYVLAFESRFGSWFLGGCHLGVAFEQLWEGGNYRVAATVRTPANSTRKVSIVTNRPVNVH